MKKIILSFVVILFAGCSRTAPEKADSRNKTEDNWFEISNSKCAYVTVDEMPCIFCENGVYGGLAPALTCDWSKSKMERTK